ncbi:TPA: hypothetical protein ACH6H0_001587 [Campylobacter jejuni]|nr:hypothetical protein [Campylobacter jejuni]
MKKKFLISGFIPHNLFEISSFLQNNGIQKARVEEKISHMLNAIKPLKNSMQSTNSFKIQKMYHCLLQDFDKESNERECYIADKNLIYVAEEWLKLDENILFILFYENPTQILKKKIFSDCKFCFKDILGEWLEYNNFMLEFYNKNKDKCVLVNYQNYSNLLSEYLSSQYNICIKQTYRNENNYICNNENLFDFLLEYVLNNNYQLISDCYGELEKLSLHCVNKTNTCINNLEKQIYTIYHDLKSFSLLKLKNEKILEHLFLMGKDFEKVYQNNLLHNYQNKKKDEIIAFYSKYGTGKQKIQSQLSYKLGQALIINSKSIFGIFSLPVILLAIIIVFNQKRKNYLKCIYKDPSKKLPSLEQYPDYDEALRLKKHLSYRLGNYIVKNPFKSFIFPYFILKIIYQFKKEKHVKR